MPKKTWNEKLNHSGDLPKVVTIDKPRFIEIYKATTMAIVPPLEYDALMKKVHKGKLITVDRMMAYMAQKHKAGCACPMTAGIFTNIAAHASEERGGKNETPWWRTLRKNGQLNEKFPGGIDGQKILLENEGHTVIQKGKNYFVQDYEKKICQFK
jgi:alkylated DNA nucleotide flippase Atl1